MNEFHSDVNVWISYITSRKKVVKFTLESRLSSSLIEGADAFSSLHSLISARPCARLSKLIWFQDDVKISKVLLFEELLEFIDCITERKTSADPLRTTKTVEVLWIAVLYSNTQLLSGDECLLFFVKERCPDLGPLFNNIESAVVAMTLWINSMVKTAFLKTFENPKTCMGWILKSYFHAQYYCPCCVVVLILRKLKISWNHCGIKLNKSSQPESEIFHRSPNFEHSLLKRTLFCTVWLMKRRKSKLQNQNLDQVISSSKFNISISTDFQFQDFNNFKLTTCQQIYYSTRWAHSYSVFSLA